MSRCFHYFHATITLRFRRHIFRLSRHYAALLIAAIRCHVIAYAATALRRFLATYTLRMNITSLHYTCHERMIRHYYIVERYYDEMSEERWLALMRYLHIITWQSISPPPPAALSVYAPCCRATLKAMIFAAVYMPLFRYYYAASHCR